MKNMLILLVAICLNTAAQAQTEQSTNHKPAGLPQWRCGVVAEKSTIAGGATVVGQSNLKNFPTVNQTKSQPVSRCESCAAVGNSSGEAAQALADLFKAGNMKGTVCNGCANLKRECKGPGGASESYETAMNKGVNNGPDTENQGSGGGKSEDSGKKPAEKKEYIEQN